MFIVNYFVTPSQSFEFFLTPFNYIWVLGYNYSLLKCKMHQKFWDNTCKYIEWLFLCKVSFWALFSILLWTWRQIHPLFQKVYTVVSNLRPTSHSPSENSNGGLLDSGREGLGKTLLDLSSITITSKPIAWCHKRQSSNEWLDLHMSVK